MADCRVDNRVTGVRAINRSVGKHLHYMKYYDTHYYYWNHAAKIVTLKSDGDIDPAVWHKYYNKNDVYLVFSGYFYGTWENSGKFFHQVDCWKDRWFSVISMFAHYGMHEIGCLYSRAMEIEMTYEGIVFDELPESIQEEINSIESQSTIGDQYGTMVSHILDNYLSYKTLENFVKHGDAPETVSAIDSTSYRHTGRSRLAR